MTMQVTDATGRTVELAAPAGRTLAQAVYLSGEFEAPALCSGVGRCGRCRVRFSSEAPAPAVEDAQVFGPDELAEGWRLGCRHGAGPGMRLFVPAQPAARAQGAEAGGAELALAVDLGTTSIHWRAMDADGEAVASGADLNPQMGAGSEVMARLAFAATEGGAEVMRQAVLDRLRSVAASLPGRVSRLAVAGNPAMTLLLLGRPTAGLATAPYVLDERGGRMAALGGGLPDAYIPPQLAPFVGGDLSAGLSALERGGEPPERPFLLADMGTNGEFILALSDGTHLSASVPLGPALEGAGLACGNVAGPGAVSRFRLTPRGLEAQCLGGGEPSRAAGITGAAYLSLLAILVEQGVLSAQGGFVLQGRTPLAARLAALVAGEGASRRLRLTGGLFLAASDVEEILKVKAAFDLACAALLDEAGLAPGALKALCLAGALGAHAAPRDLETLGFIPPGLGARVRAVGNTSLDGAALLLTDPGARAFAESLPGSTRSLDLTAKATFGQAFVARMHFGHGE